METEDFVGAGLRFANGAMGGLIATTAAYPGGTEQLVVGFERGSATLAGGSLRVNWLDGREETLGEPAATGGGADPMAFPHDWHRALITDFLDALDQGREPRVTGRGTLAVHHLIDALLLSAETGRSVAVES
jgi:predicted dehydrogenase